MNKFSSFLTTAFIGCASMGGLVGCSTTGGSPDYRNSGQLLADYERAFNDGKSYAVNTGSMPPIPLEVLIVNEQMTRNRAAVSSNVFEAIGMDWTDNILMVDDLSREENFSYGGAILIGGLAGLKEEHPEAYREAKYHIDVIRQQVLHQISHGSSHHDHTTHRRRPHGEHDHTGRLRYWGRIPGDDKRHNHFNHGFRSQRHDKHSHGDGDASMNYE